MLLLAYVALYRQWRPQDFDNLVGQEHISTTLRNAIKINKIAHAYLFAGPRGTGKTSTAKILAKALNCEQGPTPHPCNSCENCERITSGTSMDVFEIDAASNRGIDEIRDLRETVKFAPVDGRYKVYIIDEVHMLTTEAFNALLKTLEEPPEHVVFILATTEPYKIPPTIHSRCQRYDFRRIGIQDIVGRLKEVAEANSFDIEAAALTIIAMHADGGMRDALSILDQCTTLAAGKITAEHVRNLLGLIGYEWIRRLTEALAKREIVTALTLLDELIAMGKEVRQVLVETAEHLRSLMVYKAAPNADFTHMVKIADEDILRAQTALFSHSELVKMIEMLHKAANEVKWAAEPRVLAEMAFISICQRALPDEVEALIKRVEQLEQRITQGLIRVERPGSSIEDKPQPKAKAVPEIHHQQEESVQAKPKRETREVLQPNEPMDRDLESIWQNVLKQLVTEGKRSVHACVAQGRLVLLKENSAEVRFTGRFPKERTEKDDYRSIVETVLSGVCGRDVTVHCSLGAEMPDAQSVNKKNTLKVTEEHPVLRQAKDMFGGKILEQHEEE